MASTQDFIDYVIDQIGLRDLSYKKMFGEYAVYLSQKVFGFVCDNILFIKILSENESFGKDLERGPAYPGSKDYFIVDESHLDDKEWLQEFIQLTANAVPEKKKNTSNFTGVIIEESLADISILKKVKILSTKIEHVTNKHKTPWIKQWTKHKVEIEATKAEKIAEIISRSLDTTHSAWYADFKSESIHYIIYASKIFKVHRNKKAEYQSATEYGISIGIPDYQVNFSEYIQK